MSQHMRSLPAGSITKWAQKVLGSTSSVALVLCFHKAARPDLGAVLSVIL